MPINIGIARIFNNVQITSTTPLTSTFFRPIDSGYFSLMISSTCSGTLSMQGSLDNIIYASVPLTPATSTIAIGSGTLSLVAINPVLAPYYIFVFTPAVVGGSLTVQLAAV